jgi:hypothetical protein
MSGSTRSLRVFSRGFGACAYAFALGALLPASAAAQRANADTSLSFFITSAGLGKGANLGGLAGADAQCEKLAEAVDAGNRVWRAYLSTQATAGTAAVSARDRIGSGPWYNAKGVRVAASVADLHSANNKLSKENSLTEKGDGVKGRGDSPNQHDILTGSKADGTAHPAGTDLTCANWTSETTGSAMLGHHDRHGVAGNIDSTSWNQAHASSGCSQANLVSTGGNGYFYCFAADGATGMQSPARDRRLSGFTFLGQALSAGFPYGGGESPVYNLELRESRFVRVSIRTLSGRTLAEPVAEILGAGAHEIRWNGMDLKGTQVPRGYYLVSIALGDIRP